ncbi:MAG: UvrB/UvrC motif-containing protein [Phycisphaerales bacterium]|nr:UvrB/UvrC motif-containing protein [Phycisphaerales bacterium]
MKCDICDKPAVVHEVTIANGVKKEVHLCLDHARDAGVAMPGQQPINKLLSKFSVAGKPTVVAPRCEQCGTSFAQIRQNSLIGCPACYDTFEEPLGRFIERAQAGATHHVGRGLPQEEGKSRQQREERQLMRALEAALSREQYERAAEIRDQINQLSDRPSEESQEPSSEGDEA